LFFVREVNVKKNWIYFFGTVLILLYLVSLTFHEVNEISTIFVTIASIVGGIAIWIQLKREHDLNEAKFLTEYNENFICNEKLSNIQKSLEDYSKGRIKDDVIAAINRQELINYLDYLEALSALINKDTLDLRTIDNLFSYRFFLAINNPVVQSLELIPDAEFYKGCYILHKQWTKYKKKKKLAILMEEYSLEKVEGYERKSRNPYI